MYQKFINKKIRCIALDLDHTTLRSDKTLSPATKAALEHALAAGITVLPVSGRAYSTFPESILEIKGLTYAITSNGAAIYDLRTGTRVHDWLLTARDVRSILQCMGYYFMEGNVTYEAFVDGIAYGAADYVNYPQKYGVPAPSVDYVRETRKSVDYIIDFIFQNAARLDSLDLILKNNYLYNMMRKQIERNAKDIYITSAAPYRMEISHKDSGKTAGLQYVLELLDLTPDSVLAFGDGDNDADMLTYAGTGVAVKNATAACLEHADFVCGSNDDDGVAKVIEQYCSTLHPSYSFGTQKD